MKMAAGSLLIIMFISLSCQAHAQEIFYYRGASYRTSSGEHSTTWGLTYLGGLEEHAAWSLSYLNEGKIEDHKRDGLGAPGGVSRSWAAGWSSQPGQVRISTTIP